MSCDWSQNRTAMLMEMRLAFGMPRRVTRLKADHHSRMAEHWVDHARSLGRPAYHEPQGFTRDRWQLEGSRAKRSICGHEKPYGYGSRAFWKHLRLAMRAAFLAEWHRAAGTTYETAEGGRRQLAVITNLTA